MAKKTRFQIMKSALALVLSIMMILGCTGMAFAVEGLPDKILEFDFSTVSANGTTITGTSKNGPITATANGISFANGVATFPAAGADATTGITFAPTAAEDPMDGLSGNGATIAMWVKTAENPFSSNLFAYGTLNAAGNGLGYSAQIHGRTGNNAVVLYRNDAGQTGGHKINSTTNNYIVGQWQLVTLVESADGSHTFYIDGNRIGTYGAQSGKNLSAIATRADVLNTYYIGYLPYASDGDTHFVGSIDSVTVYDGALTAAQVTALYNEYFEGKEFTVTLNANGGTGIPASISVANGSAMSNLPTPTKVGHTFLGWTDEQGNTVTSSTIYTKKGESTLTAQWELQTATLKAGDVNVVPGEQVKVPVYLTDVDGLAAIDGGDGALGGFQFRVTTSDALKLIGFESDVLTGYDLAVGYENNGIVLGYKAEGEGVALSALKNVPFGYMVFETTDKFETTSVTISDVSMTDSWAVDYSEHINVVETFTITAGEAPVVPDPELFDIAGANNMMGNELAMYFYIRKSDLNGTDYYAQITRTYSNGNEDRVLTYNFSQWENYNASMYRVKLDNIAAAEMTDEIYVTVYNSDGTPASHQWVDSMRDYGMRALAASVNNEIDRTMYADMLIYGAAAQEAFGYNTADLATSQMSATQLSYATKNISLNNRQVKGDNFFGTTLSYEDKINMTLFFSGVTRDMSAVVEFTNMYGQKVTVNVSGDEFFQRNSTVYGVLVDELACADFRQMVTCTIYNANGTVYGTVQDSMESYAARALNAGSAPLYEKAANFSQSCYNYLVSLLG